MTIQKVTSTDRVEILRDAAPNMAASTMARVLGITRERVRQILVELSLPTAPNERPLRCQYVFRSGRECGYTWPRKVDNPKKCPRCYHWIDYVNGEPAPRQER